MAFINMGADDHLIIWQIFGSKFLGDFQSQFRSDLSWFEGLYNVIALASVQFSDRSFRVHHLSEFPAWVTVLMSGKYLVIRFISVQHILDSLIQAGVPGEYFGNSHYFLAI